MLTILGFGFVLGVAVAVIGVVKLIALSNRLAGKTAGRPARFYLNVHVLNTDEIVEHAVKEKAGKACETGLKIGHYRVGTLTGKVLGAVGSRVAVKAVEGSEEKLTAVTEKIAERVVSKMPLQLKDQGIEATATLAFARGSFFIVEVTINHADMVRLVAAKSAEKAAKVQQGLDLLSRFEGLLRSNAISSSLDPLVNQMVAQKLELALPSSMHDKLLKEGGVQIEAVAFEAAEEVAYILQQLSPHADDKPT